LVIGEEFGLKVLVDADTVCLDLNSRQSLLRHGVADATSLVNELGVVGRSGAIRRHEGRGSQCRGVSVRHRQRDLRLGSRVHEVGHVAGEPVPVAPFRNVTRAGGEAVAGIRGSGGVEQRAHTGVDGLNGPFQLGEQNLGGRDTLLRAVESVHSDERKSYPFYINVMAMVPAVNLLVVANF
jgi:hypothetical protein